MEWIPYKQLTITTNLTRDELIDRMRKWVGPKRKKNFVRVDKNIFSGRLINDKFEFTLQSDYRNSWTPEITVTILEINGKVELNVRLKSNWFVIVFSGLFMSIGLAILIAEIIYYKDIDDINWIPLVFIIFPYGLFWFGFNMDASKSIDGLIKISKGNIK